jgi:DNA adenine methylase
VRPIGQRYASPLRYPGGKAKVANFVKLILMENNLVGCRYVEPYAGGASVALSLLFEDWVETVHMNDLNAGVHAFWQSVLHETDKLCGLVLDTPLDVEQWRYQREKAFAFGSTQLERGFATFYLNRTNRSGIIAGGVIGGLDQTGPWKMDARYSRDELIRRIRKVARFRSRITVTCNDTALLLAEAAAQADPGVALYFLDPPYYVKGKGLYDNFYKHEDHVLIHDAVLALNQPWIVSYDAAPEILGIWADRQPLDYSLAYSASSRQDGQEVMFLSPELVVPGGSPASVPQETVSRTRSRLLDAGFR